MKLLGKETVVPQGRQCRAVLRPAVSVAVPRRLFGLVIVPVPGHAVGSFPGDIVLLLYLLEVPVICDVMAGYVSQSIYGQVSAMREAVMSLAYNLPLLAAVIAMAQNAGSFRLGDLAICSLRCGHCPGRDRLSAWRFRRVSRAIRFPSPMPNRRSWPAHTSNTTAPRLAIFELSHALEVVLLFDVFFVLFVPHFGNPARQRGAVPRGQPCPDRAGDPDRGDHRASHGEAGVSVLLGLGRAGRRRRRWSSRSSAEGTHRWAFSASSGGISVAARERGAPTDMPADPVAVSRVDRAGCKPVHGLQGLCDVSAAPKAISFDEEQDTGITWNFFAGQCSFCGLVRAILPDARDHQPRQAAARHRRPVAAQSHA